MGLEINLFTIIKELKLNKFGNNFNAIMEFINENEEKLTEMFNAGQDVTLYFEDKPILEMNKNEFEDIKNLIILPESVTLTFKSMNLIIILGLYLSVRLILAFINKGDMTLIESFKTVNFSFWYVIIFSFVVDIIRYILFRKNIAKYKNKYSVSGSKIDFLTFEANIKL